MKQSLTPRNRFRLPAQISGNLLPVSVATTQRYHRRCVAVQKFASTKARPTGDQNRGERSMLKHSALKWNSATLSAVGAFAIGALALSGPAHAAPPTPFPFLLAPPAQQYQPYDAAPPAQAAPSEDEGTAYEMPARLRRQVVNYATREAPGTIIIDTPNTYLYYVLGNGQALRYGIGV